MFHKIEIKAPESYDDSNAHIANGTIVLVDGREFHGVKSIDTRHAVDEIPEVEMVVIPSRCNIEMCAELNLRVDVESIGDAISCIQFTIKLDDDFRNGILTGIADVLQNEHDNLPEKIMNRVFGLD